MKQSDWNHVRDTQLIAESCGREFHVRLRPHPKADKDRGFWALCKLAEYMNTGYGPAYDTKGPCLIVSLVRIKDWRLNVELPQEMLDV